MRSMKGFFLWGLKDFTNVEVCAIYAEKLFIVVIVSYSHLSQPFFRAVGIRKILAYDFSAFQEQPDNNYCIGNACNEVSWDLLLLSYCTSCIVNKSCILV
jgi:hypothetical protein